MRKTTFAGLTVLEPGEPLTTDGGSFLSRNPEITDYFLGLIKTHRHDAHAPLADPIPAPALTTDATGGSLPPDLTVTAVYTLLDDQGGETLPSPVAAVTTASPVGPPQEAPTAVVDTTAGALVADVYAYVVTLTDDQGGETTPGPAVRVTRDPGPANARIVLSGLTAVMAASPGATGWRLYRAKGAGDFDLLSWGAADSFTDDGSVPVDCGVEPPSVDTTNGANQVTLNVPVLPADAVGFRIYVSTTGDFTSPALLGTTRLPAEAGVDIVLGTIALEDGQPPDVSTSIGGSTLIAGGGGTGPLLSGDSIEWRDALGNPIVRLTGTSSPGGTQRANDFTAGEYNPAPATFDTGQGAGTSDLAAKVGTSEAAFYGSFGFADPLPGAGAIEGTFTIVDASAGWDVLGVGWGEVDRAGNGLFVKIDRAAGEVQLVWDDGTGPVVLGSAAYTAAVVDGSEVILGVTRVADPLGFAFHVTATVDSIEDVAFDYTGPESQGWSLHGQLWLAWTDPAAFTVGRVAQTRDSEERTLYVEVIDPEGNSQSKLLLNDVGTSDGLGGGSAAQRQKAGIVLADGSTPGDTCMVTKTGVGTYDVSYWSGLVNDGIIVVVTTPEGVVSNVSEVGFTVTFGADTDFRFITVVQP